MYAASASSIVLAHRATLAALESVSPRRSVCNKVACSTNPFPHRSETGVFMRLTSLPRPLLSILASAALWIPTAPGIEAQQPSAQPAAGSMRGGTKPLTPTDIKAWMGIRGSALSNDGKWFGYVIGPNEGDNTVVIRSIAEG